MRLLGAGVRRGAVAGLRSGGARAGAEPVHRAPTALRGALMSDFFEEEMFEERPTEPEVEPEPEPPRRRRGRGDGEKRGGRGRRQGRKQRRGGEEPRKPKRLKGGGGGGGET